MEEEKQKDDHHSLSPSLPKYSTAKKLKPIHKTFLIERLKQFDTLGEAATALKEEFNITVSIQTVRFYSIKYKSEIEQGRIESTKKIFSFPIAHKFYRLKRLTNMLHNLNHLNASPTDLKRLELQILAQARAEIGEDFEKIADALRESGNRTYYYDFSNHSEAERSRLLGETAAVVFGIGGGANRM